MYFRLQLWHWQFVVKLTIFPANFDFRVRKTTGAVRSGKFPLGHPYGDNALSRNEIEQMASYRSYSVTGPRSAAEIVENAAGTPQRRFSCAAIYAAWSAPEYVARYTAIYAA